MILVTLQALLCECMKAKIVLKKLNRDFYRTWDINFSLNLYIHIIVTYQNDTYSELNFELCACHTRADL